MSLRDLLRFTAAFCAVTFVDGFIAGFMHREPASFVQVVTIALVVTVLLVLREKRA